MKKIIPTLKLLSFAIFALPPIAIADSWNCRNDNDVREIHIVRHSADLVPCSVVYKKLTEGFEDQVLWTADFDPNYCDEKAMAFVDNQVGWGWTCVETIDTTPVVE